MTKQELDAIRVRVEERKAGHHSPKGVWDNYQQSANDCATLLAAVDRLTAKLEEMEEELNDLEFRLKTNN